MEVEWGARPLAEAVRELRDRFGSHNVVAVAVDMAVVHVKRLDLPPLPAEQRRRMIATDPHRYFPVRGEPLVAGVRDDDLVVAAPGSLLGEWTEA
ncbi:MAG: hypothetical protein GWM90_29820, partial [Gemmatimonadetes bacterium]|nr:hypothetical protein [Gemmatimonadota bacterium]NIQ59279.1 hypothetical protein [Gemmatimonadota bacterium]NIU79466.1 hypothetical protein [Gammaproteobacteria bacterium]NIX48115.1 hypothetical protein [Gemmatimonadota bacterium]